MAECTETKKDPLLLLTPYKTQFPGRMSGLSVVPQLKLAVSVTDCSMERSLYYHIGRITPNLGDITWHENRYYTTGISPSIALIVYRGQVYAVEVHNPHTAYVSDKCHYCVWKVAEDFSEMLGSFQGRHLANGGLYPSLCANNEGWCCVIFEGATYSIGKLDFDDPDLSVSWKSFSFPYSTLKPAIAMQGSTVVAVFRMNSVMHSIVGTLNATCGIVEWRNEVSQVPSGGIYPSIALNSSGNITLCYQNRITRSIGFTYGMVKQSTTIEWYQQQLMKSEQTSGEYPSVVLTDNGNIFLLYKKWVGTTLLLKSGEIRYLSSTPVIVPSPIPITVEERENDESQKQCLPELQSWSYSVPIRPSPPSREQSSSMPESTYELFSSSFLPHPPSQTT